MGATLARGDATIAAIVARSRPLYERLARARAEAADDCADAELPSLDAWRAVVTNGDEPTFARRLAWDGLDTNHARRVLVSSSEPLDDAEPPSWAETLAAALEREPASDRACRADAPLPFEMLLVPFVALARERAADRAGAAYALAGDDAHASLERALLGRLTTICARGLFAEFAVYRSYRQQTSFGGLFGGDTIFSAFVENMRTGGFLEFFNQHPVAARLCATVTDLWVDTVTELVERLAADLPAIEQTFNGGAPLGVVAEMRTNMSDPHEGGRSVIIVRWADGPIVVYKPRPIGVEACFGDLVRWLNARAPGLALRALNVVARPTHGWIEFADHRPCETPAQVERYYTRCGALLCLAYAMNGSDFHYENLIAAGEHPILIDLESLLGHRFELAERVADPSLAGQAARQRSMESVLNVRLLPLIKVGNNGQTFEVGGLGGPSDAGGTAPQLETVTYWKHMNADAMKLDQTSMPVAAGGHNLPVLNGARVAAAGFVDAIVDGFTHTYRTLLADRESLTTTGGPLEQFAGQQVRFILRNTSLYGAALERCFHPRFLRDGAERGVQLDALSRVLLTLDARPAVWPIVDAEHRALEQLDIPLFSARADSRDLVLSTGEIIEDCFRTSAFDEVRARVARLSASDLRAQCDIIRGSFRANAARDLVSPRATHASSPRGVPRDADRSKLAKHAIALATAVADDLRETSIGGETEASWLGVSYLSEARRYMLGPMSSSFFDGYAGIAMFLAAVERATGGAGFRALALSAAAPLRTRVDELARSVSMRRSVDVGAATGLGSLVYALVRAGRLLDEPAMVSDAARIAALITPATVAVADSLDVVSGSAGAILGLLALHAAAPASRALDLAAAMGAGLAGRSLREPGFAHGQTGIGYALARLAHATGDAAFREAAVAAVATERAMIGDRLGAVTPHEPNGAWSRGATGIGLARLGALDCIDTPESRTDIERALSLAQDDLFAGGDSLACGAAGRIDLLVTAAERLGRPELLEDARAAAASIVERAVTRGSFDTGWDEPRTWQVGLFCGAPGVCYALLRACDPMRFPSVLLWS